MFPVLLGGAIVVSGVLFYFVHADVDLSATRGAIAHRDVYRDADVKPGDVGTPGAAPVAVTAVLQNSNFKELAKNPAFQQLMSNQAFHELAKNEAFYALLRNSSFQQMMANAQFRAMVTNQAKMNAFRADLTSNMTANMNAELRPSLTANLSTELRQNAAFNNLVHNQVFMALLRQDAFANLLANSNFADLVNMTAFQNLTSNAAFQNSLMQGNAAQLTTAMGGGGKGRDR